MTGYFPKTGLKKYDLYGDALVKATRYESMRKVLFKKGIPRGNIVILQSRVFDLLPENAREEFIEFPLDTVRVRDDKKADRLYYKVYPPASVDQKLEAY